MYPSESRDLAISALIYLVAIAFGLAIIVVPVYLMNRPTVVPNPSARILERNADRALSSHANRKLYPVAHLKHEPIVNRAIVEALDAKAEAKADERDNRRTAHSARGQYDARRTDEFQHARPSYATNARSSYPNFSTLF